MDTRISGAVVTAAAAAAIVITCATGAPAPLPDIALGSTVLFHLMRAIAILASCVALLVIVTRAWSGQLPNELSTQGVRYAAEGTRDATSGAMEAASIEIELLKARVDRLDQA